MVTIRISSIIFRVCVTTLMTWYCVSSQIITPQTQVTGSGTQAVPMSNSTPSVTSSILLNMTSRVTNASPSVSPNGTVFLTSSSVNLSNSTAMNSSNSSAPSSQPQNTSTPAALPIIFTENFTILIPSGNVSTQTPEVTMSSMGGNLTVFNGTTNSTARPSNATGANGSSLITLTGPTTAKPGNISTGTNGSIVGGVTPPSGPITPTINSNATGANGSIVGVPTVTGPTTARAGNATGTNGTNVGSVTTASGPITTGSGNATGGNGSIVIGNLTPLSALTGATTAKPGNATGSLPSPTTLSGPTTSGFSTGVLSSTVNQNGTKNVTENVTQIFTQNVTQNASEIVTLIINTNVTQGSTRHGTKTVTTRSTSSNTAATHPGNLTTAQQNSTILVPLTVNFINITNTFPTNTTTITSRQSTSASSPKASSTNTPSLPFIVTTPRLLITSSVTARPTLTNGTSRAVTSLMTSVGLSVTSSSRLTSASRAATSVSGGNTAGFPNTTSAASRSVPVGVVTGNMTNQTVVVTTSAPPASVTSQSITATTTACLRTNITWTLVQNAVSLNGVAYPNITNLTQCENLCVSIPACVAIEIDLTTGINRGCWIHTNSSDLGTLFDGGNTATHYEIQRNCNNAPRSSAYKAVESSWMMLSLCLVLGALLSAVSKDRDSS